MTQGFYGLEQQRAFALPDYKKEFFNLYVDKNATDPNAKAFAEAANSKAGKCYICHVNVKTLDEKNSSQNLSATTTARQLPSSSPKTTSKR